MPVRSRRLVAFALAALAILLGLGGASTAQTQTPLQPAVLDLTLNTERHGEIRVLIGIDNEMWAEVGGLGRAGFATWTASN